ncbi:glycoside hydrolase family 99-like domain-containing protein [Parapedobacter sp. GCM10030251]|uniref:glycosyltransferase WbsX family protein n=1 Tax=Parapedobacter sp. GCM10030251 TaxID=3273419 RepID=UPI0036135668
MDFKKPVMSNNVRLIAYYLPQFHPIPENNLWHGEGFTEWTNVRKAKPLFKGHYQPRVPADLGYYDLREPDVRIRQAEMAEAYGITGFCYWHYWFGRGKRLLERPFNEVLTSGQPDFPFCLGWANETWRGVWHGVSKGKVLIEQQYPGKEDYIAHFNALLPAFRDERYLTIDDRPIFVIYMPDRVPDFELMREIWNDLAIKNGLKGIYFIGHSVHSREVDGLLADGYDAVNLLRLYHIRDSKITSWADRLFNKLDGKRYNIFPYSEAMKFFSGPEDSLERCYPTLIPNWDHSPRSGNKAYILTGSTPALFGKHIRTTLDTIKNKSSEHRVAFIKSWNEWGEGNYLEPDVDFGRQYLETLKSEVERFAI